jgi:4-oxalocrotonate tautomerase
MPHVVVKLLAGRSEEQKARVAEAITQAITSTVNPDPGSVSVAIVDIPREEWMATVYEPEITGKAETLYKKPGYGPSAA